MLNMSIFNYDLDVNFIHPPFINLVAADRDKVDMYLYSNGINRSATFPM